MIIGHGFYLNDNNRLYTVIRADVSKEKILAIKFKYLGDVAVCTPALRALRAHFPTAELHALVASDAVPLLENIPWLDRVWGIGRGKNGSQPRKLFALIRKLRSERFTHSVDFVGNDRGAIFSRAIGARYSIGLRIQRGPFWRRCCYSETIEELDPNRHEAIRDIYALKPLGIELPENLSIETPHDPDLDETVPELARNSVLVHCTSSQKKKEWSIEHLLKLHEMALEHGLHLVFSAGPEKREQGVLSSLRSRDETVRTLPVQTDLRRFVATVASCRAMVSVDTSVLHIAAGLKKPTIGLFGPTDSHRWGPLGESHVALQGKHCACSGHNESCDLKSRCIDHISPKIVWEALEKL